MSISLVSFVLLYAISVASCNDVLPVLYLAPSECLLTVSAFSFNSRHPPEEAKSFFSRYCSIDYFYWVTDIAYDPATLGKDVQSSYPYVIRSNVERDGYLSFIAPLLYNSTYTLIIDSDELTDRLPSSTWLNEALTAIYSDPTVVPVCGLYEGSQVARGCMLVKSLDLRFIWTMTTFRRKQTKAMEIMSHILRCLYHYRLVDSLYPRPELVATTVHPSPYVETACEMAYDVKGFQCKADYPVERTTGIVLSQFKRPYLEQQLLSIRKGSANCSEIIIVQGGVHKNYGSVLNRWPAVKHVWMTNWDSPYFFRFLISFELTSYYIHQVNDDIVFGRTTLHTLNQLSSQHHAPVGVKGRTVLSLDYKKGLFTQNNMQSSTLAVDFLIGTFGGMMEHMKIFWRYRAYTQRNAEDIHFSLTSMMECNTFSRVPHASNKLDAITDYGTDQFASYKKSGHFEIRGKILRFWFSQGAPFLKRDALSAAYNDNINKSFRRLNYYF